MRNPVRGIDRRSPLAKRRGAPGGGGGGGGPARNPVTITTTGLVGTTLSATLTCPDAEPTDTVHVVAVPTAQGAPSAAQIAVGDNALGGDATAYATALWSAGTINIAFPAGVALDSFTLFATIFNGVLSPVVSSTSFNADTKVPVDSGVLFADNGAEQMTWQGQSDEAATYRAVLYPTAATPSDDDIAAGVGASFTAAGSVAAATPVSGTFITGPGTFKPFFVLTDGFNNRTIVRPANVPVAASNPRLTTPLNFYWLSSDTTTRSGSDVTAITDKRGGFPLGARPNPPFTLAIQQASAGGVMQFGATAGLMTATKVAGNRKLMNHLLAGGSNAIRAFLAIDVSGLGDTAQQVFFSETNDTTDSQAIFFGARVVSGNLWMQGGVKRFSDAVVFSGTTGVTAAAAGLCILEFRIGQTQAFAYLNGVQIGAALTVTPANFPNPATCWTTLGARATNLAAASPALGRFREFYATGTADDTTATAIRAAMAAQWGITL